MYQSTDYVDKTTDTFADVLLAYGVAALLERLLQASVGQKTVRVRDAGGVYAIALEDPMEEGFEDLDWFCDLPRSTRCKLSPPTPRCSPPGSSAGPASPACCACCWPSSPARPTTQTRPWRPGKQ